MNLPPPPAPGPHMLRWGGGGERAWEGHWGHDLGFKDQPGDFLFGGPVAKSLPSKAGAQSRSLVSELRSHMPRCRAKRLKLKKKISALNYEAGAVRGEN